MYQGIFDTDFDKYTEDAVALFTSYGIDTVFENLEGFPDGLEDERRPPSSKFVREHQRPSFLEYGEYPYVSADEIKKALRLKRGVLRDARPDAVSDRWQASCSTGRHPALPLDADAGAGRALRVPPLPDSASGPRLAFGHAGEGGQRGGGGPRRAGCALGDGGLHLERAARARAWTRPRSQTFPEEFREGMAARAPDARA